MKKLDFDIVIIGASLGGCMAALSAAKKGKKVVLTEEVKWIGGQLTSQAVPNDEHKWIEEFGCTKTYRQYRNSVRQFYKDNFNLYDGIDIKKFDPGNSYVSRIAHDPRVALSLIENMLLPYRLNGSLTVLTEWIPIDAVVEGDFIKSVIIKKVNSSDKIMLSGKYFIDATDTGELLPLTNTEYVTGAESFDETLEPHAAKIKDPEDMQPITWVAAVDYVEEEDYTIEKPYLYHYFKRLMQPYDKYPVLSWYGPDSLTGKAKKFGMFESDDNSIFPLWAYRRIAYPGYYKDRFFQNDITLINWPQNDYFLGNIIDTKDKEKNKEAAKQLTLSLIYYLQTEAERFDNGIGYKGIRLRPDVVGTEDGLAMAPYIRESRRIKAEYTVVEQDISAKYKKELPKFHDTVGVGCYHIDLHITTKSHSFYFDKALPFEIPLGVMIPIRMKNLIPGCKNIGTTHITNGCFRLHPVEWNIGEVAGLLSSFAIDSNKLPRDIRNDKNLLADFQKILLSEGIELHWPKDMKDI